MRFPLRPYQSELVYQVEQQWQRGARNVLLRAATGAGKTVMFGDIIGRHPGASCLIVHRKELVEQISLTLAGLGLRHDIIAPDAVCRAIAKAHVEEYGSCFYQPGARCRVASVDTLIRRKDLAAWAAQVTLWVNDEGHHVLLDNKWGDAIGLFTHPACHGLLPTATPERADRKGLSRVNADGTPGDGLVDVMVEGPPERWLIEQGYLTDYRVVCPTSDIQILGDLPASGDYSAKQLKEAARHSRIVGDLPQAYMQFAPGTLGLSFCPDVDTAIATAEMYNALGVSAQVVTGNTHPMMRREAFRRFKRREVLQLCVVDIVSEGTDLPACQTGSFGRPSESLGLVRQQMGRILRPMYARGPSLDTQEGRLEAIALSEKPHAMLIDHVQHFVKPHIGPPDRARVWNIDRRSKRSEPDDAIPLRICTRPIDDEYPVGCFKSYERFHRACPYCGFQPEPAGRATPAQVEGDMGLLDPAVLKRLRGEVVDVSEGAVHDKAREWADTGLPQHMLQSNAKAYSRKVEAQLHLREIMGRWGHVQHAAGLDDVQIQRRFWLAWGLSVLEAQALGPTQAYGLAERMGASIGIDVAVNDG